MKAVIGWSLFGVGLVLLLSGSVCGLSQLHGASAAAGLVGLGVGGAMAGIGLAFTLLGLRLIRSARLDALQAFEDAVRQLAARTNGQVTLADAARATGLPTGDAEQRMRALCGRGIFEVDFTPEGQLVFKATPLAEGASQLARLTEGAPK